MKQPMSIDEISQLTGLNPFQIARALPESVLLHHRFEVEKNQRDAEEHTNAINYQKFKSNKKTIEGETEWLELLIRNKRAHEELQATEQMTARRVRMEKAQVMEMLSIKPKGVSEEQWNYFNEILKYVLQKEQIEALEDIRAKRDFGPGIQRVNKNARAKFTEKVSRLFRRKQEPEPEPGLPIGPVPSSKVNLDPGRGDVKQELKRDLDEVSSGQPQPLEFQGEKGGPVHNGQSAGEILPEDGPTDIPGTEEPLQGTDKGPPDTDKA